MYILSQMDHQGKYMVFLWDLAVIAVVNDNDEIFFVGSGDYSPPVVKLHKRS